MRYNNVTLTHTPTGESARVDSPTYRSMHHKRVAALQVLKSRLYAAQNSIERSDKEVAVYELPDEEPFPHELSDYKLSRRQSD